MMNLLSIAAGTWKTVGIVAAIFAGAALLIGILIIVVGKVFKVDVDEKIAKITENLAGANCGGCGCSGCAGFAAKLASGGADLGDCHVTAPENKEEIAKILGIELKREARTVAAVRCHGSEDNCLNRFEYKGNPTCASCSSLLGGNKNCPYACLGCGDCKAACPEHAIEITGRLAKIDPDKCISCGACILACPKHIIERIPASAPVFTPCSSKRRAKDVMNVCKAGCIACGICARSCPHGAIVIKDNLPVFDYSKCTGCLTCVEKCPRKIIESRNVLSSETPKPASETPAAETPASETQAAN